MISRHNTVTYIREKFGAGTVSEILKWPNFLAVFRFSLLYKTVIPTTGQIRSKSEHVPNFEELIKDETQVVFLKIYYQEQEIQVFISIAINFTALRTRRKQ